MSTTPCHRITVRVSICVQRRPLVSHPVVRKKVAINALTTGPAGPRPTDGPVSRRSILVPPDASRAQHGASEDSLSLSDPFGPSSSPQSAIPRSTRSRLVASFLAELQRSGPPEALSTGRRLAGRFTIDPSIDRSALLGFVNGVDRLSGEKDILRAYLSLINALLEDPGQGEGVSRFLRGEDDFLGDGLDETLVETLRRLFLTGSGSVQGFAEALSQVVLRVRVSVSEQAPQPADEADVKVADPLVLDLAGDGVRTTGLGPGAAFDVTGDGRPKRTSFVKGDDALLSLDRNGNGIVDNGRELFGDQDGAPNGFQALSRFDENRDGLIDEADSVYERLGVFQDLNADGISQPGELRGLRPAGISAVSVRYEEVNRDLPGGDRVGQRSFFVRSDGSKGQAVDLLLRYTGTKARGAEPGLDLRG